MKNSKGYEINFERKVIIMTKKFYKAAGVLGSPEYKLICELREQFADFSMECKIIERKENKVSYPGLTYGRMEQFICSRQNSKEELEYYKGIRAIQGKKRGAISIVKRWFLNTYKEEYLAWENLDTEKQSKDFKDIA